MDQTILIPVPLSDYWETQRTLIREELGKLINPPKEETELITRHEASDILKVSLPTLNEYTKTGKIPAYRIGSRIRYKKNEVYEALKNIQRFKR